MKFRTLEYILAVSLALVAFIGYLLTLCPTVDVIDAGELATVCTTLGIAHPTGYPLFTLIGWLFAHFPLGFRTIYKLNLMSAVECSVALFFFFRFLVFFLHEFLPKNSKQGGNQSKNENITQKEVLQVFIPASCGTLALAFSETFWSQALSIEVYPLHVLFLSVLLLLFTKSILNETQLLTNVQSMQMHRSYLYGFAYVLGLSFVNHMTTILLAPAFLYYFFFINGFSFVTWKKLSKLIVPFLLGLSVYLYFPIRANEHPVLSWGNVFNLERMLWHVSGKQYRVWMFQSTDAAAKQFAYFTDTVLPEFGYIPLFLALLGLWKLFKSTRSLFLFTVLLFLSCLLYSINYDIHDIDSYFLLVYFTIAIWIAIGASYLLQSLSHRHTVKIVAVVVMVVCLSPLFYNYARVDESKNYIIEDYTKNVFTSLAPNAIIISYQWDYFVSSAYYFQLVENIRPDIIVIDKELLRRSWYYLQLESRYPELIHQVKPELDNFLHELFKFEHDIPYDPNIIERRYTALIKSIIDKSITTRPVYVTYEIEQQYTANYNRVPSGLTFQLFPDTSFHDIEVPDLSFNAPQRDDRYSRQVISLYAQAYTNKAIYLYLLGQNEQSKRFLNKALEILPNFAEALALKNRIR